jgi:hypothetical protein
MLVLRNINWDIKRAVKRKVQRKENPACRSMEEAQQSTLSS